MAQPRTAGSRGGDRALPAIGGWLAGELPDRGARLTRAGPAVDGTRRRPPAVPCRRWPGAARRPPSRA
ncbi:hypothetical protein VARIO8X_130174 [Burkholderiales bacterium 8X]|nr:hypothetical protein VARIO8X_130174 [Burkholderiales bacterium 8X]